jgi:hypothetical protein
LGRTPKKDDDKYRCRSELHIQFMSRNTRDILNRQQKIIMSLDVSLTVKFNSLRQRPGCKLDEDIVYDANVHTI